MAEKEWIEHKSALNNIWEYFLRSKNKISRKEIVSKQNVKDAML